MTHAAAAATAAAAACWDNKQLMQQVARQSWAAAMEDRLEQLRCCGAV
jgi:hypothetical protein